MEQKRRREAAEWSTKKVKFAINLARLYIKGIYEN